ncbi:hypothetical protein G155_00228 [Mycobacterium sp. VKM Ac-1817D]|nr:hypothetical protein G155_00228 [Mycobacterium sp. VKM Ac-1817D]
MARQSAVCPTELFEKGFTGYLSPNRSTVFDAPESSVVRSKS